MLYLELYFAFIKIGFSSFGGMSAIPLILEEMERHQWMTAQDLPNLIGIAEMTPGPLGLNCATFAGLQTAGTLGGIVAVLGVLAPAYSLAALAAVFYTRFKESTVMQWIMKVVKPITIAMVLDVLVSQSLQNYITDRMPDIRALSIGILCFYLLQKKHWSVPKVIVIACVLGIILFGLF